MSELKEHIFCDIDEVFPRGHCGPLPSHEARPYYLKSEVDKVIAEMEADIAVLKEQVHDYALGSYVMQARAEKEARHHKYKRCLAMASFCFTKSLFLRYVLADRIQNGENCLSANDWRINLYEQWCERWKKLAEKFKEAK